MDNSARYDFMISAMFQHTENIRSIAFNQGCSIVHAVSGERAAHLLLPQEDRRDKVSQTRLKRQVTFQGEHV